MSDEERSGEDRGDPPDDDLSSKNVRRAQYDVRPTRLGTVWLTVNATDGFRAGDWVYLDSQDEVTPTSNLESVFLRRVVGLREDAVRLGRPLHRAVRNDPRVLAGRLAVPKPGCTA